MDVSRSESALVRPWLLTSPHATLASEVAHRVFGFAQGPRVRLVTRKGIHGDQLRVQASVALPNCHHKGRLLNVENVFSAQFLAERSKGFRS